MEEAQWMRQVLTGVLEPMAGEIREVDEPEESEAEQQASEWILSSWTLAHFCGEQVRTMLRGAWSRQRMRACQHALLRYVRSRKRPRGHRESEQRAWLQSRCPQQAGAAGPEVRAYGGLLSLIEKRKPQPPGCASNSI